MQEEDIGNSGIPQPTSKGSAPFPPASLSSRQDKLCNKLDDLQASYPDLKMSLSDAFRGAVFASRPECRSNPDWLCHAASSLRGILFPFYDDEVTSVPDKKKDALIKYGSIRTDEAIMNRMGALYNTLSGLAHHGTIVKKNVDLSQYTRTDFDALLIRFEETMLDALSRQTDIHEDIDIFVSKGPPTT